MSAVAEINSSVNDRVYANGDSQKEQADARPAFRECGKYSLQLGLPLFHLGELERAYIKDGDQRGKVNPQGLEFSDTTFVVSQGFR
jgi:hypothetical protein